MRKVETISKPGELGSSMLVRNAVGKDAHFTVFTGTFDFPKVKSLLSKRALRRPNRSRPSDSPA